MTTINQLLNVKGHGYLSVGPDETVYALYFADTHCCRHK